MKKKTVLQIALLTVATLLIPLIAMQFTEEVDWSLSDFIIMGLLIFVTGTGINWAINRTNSKYKFFIAGAILFVLLLLWAEMAVGVFNSPIAGS